MGDVNMFKTIDDIIKELERDEEPFYLSERETREIEDKHMTEIQKICQQCVLDKEAEENSKTK